MNLVLIKMFIKFKENVLIKSILISIIFTVISIIGVKNSYGYSITLHPLEQSIYVREFPNGDPNLSFLSATGTDYAEFSGQSHQDTWLTVGASLSSGTSKLYTEGELISCAFIESEAWSDFTNVITLETDHYIRGKYLLNISSDNNSSDAITITDWININTWAYSLSEFSIYDTSDNLITDNSWSPINLISGVNYIVNYYRYYDNFENMHSIHKIGFEISETAPVPEPTTILLFGTGLAGLVRTQIRKRNK